MTEKEELNPIFKRYLTVALACGILGGLAVSCMDLLLFCKTIAKYFFELHTIFVLEGQLISVYLGIFVILGLIVVSFLVLYDWSLAKKRDNNDIFLKTLFGLYIIFAVLFLYVSFYHCQWRSKSFSIFISKIRYLVIVPLPFCYFFKKKINTFCENKGLFSIISFCFLFIISTIALLNYLLLFKLTDSGRLLAQSLALFPIYLFILFFMLRRIFSIKNKNLFTPILIVALMYSIPVVYSLTLSKETRCSKIAERKKIYQPNILLIVCDALRTDALSIYGGNNQTPNIDSLAREGVYFKKAYSVAPWTIPSIFSLFTSYYPSIFDHGDSNLTSYLIDETHKTLPEYLKDQGYFCKGLVGNFLLRSECGINQGFHEYLVLNNLSARSQFLYIFPIFGEIEHGFLKMVGGRYFIDTTKILTKEAIDFFKRTNKSRWFLWIHYMDPHDPYYPPRKYLKLNGKELKEISFNPYYLAPSGHRSGWPQIDDLRAGMTTTRAEKDHIKMLYLAEVRYLDDMIGELIKEMKKLNLYDNTIIVLTSDHGEEFWDHGSYGHYHTLYDELLSVPLIFRGPGVPRGKVISEKISLIDLMTILTKGLSLWNMVDFSKRISSPGFNEFLGNDYIFSEGNLCDKSEAVIRDSEFKLIYSFESKKMELYNIVHDPFEEKDISKSHNEIGKSMVEELERWKKRNEEQKNAFRGKASVEVFSREDALRRLKALGYVQ